MRAEFLDMQDPDNPMNGAIASSAELRRALAAMRSRPPFIGRLVIENRIQLIFGIGPLGCVQVGSADSRPPYRMTVAPDADNSEEEVVFLCGDTATPMLRRHCLPYEEVVDLLATFMDTGEPKKDVLWEEV